MIRKKIISDELDDIIRESNIKSLTKTQKINWTYYMILILFGIISISLFIFSILFFHFNIYSMNNVIFQSENVIFNEHLDVNNLIINDDITVMGFIKVNNGTVIMTIGPPGIFGPPGNLGPTGNPGQMGIIGEMGINGSIINIFVNNSSPIGPPGINGTNGMNIIGAPGQKGLDGPQGNMGISNSTNGTGMYNVIRYPIFNSSFIVDASSYQEILAQDFTPLLSWGFSCRIYGNLFISSTIEKEYVDIYEYSQIQGKFLFLQRLNTFQNNSDFGYSIDIFQEKIIIGAPNFIVNSVFEGRVFYYERNNLTHLFELKQILFGISSETINFGFNVHFSDQSQLFIGAPSSDNGRGYVFIFSFNSTVWIQEIFLQPPGAIITDNFGSGRKPISFFSPFLFIGVPLFDTSLSQIDTGKVLIYQKISFGVWSLIQTIFPPTLVTQGKFGNALDSYNNFTIIGFPINDRAYIYLRTMSTTYTLFQTIIPLDIISGDQFGTNVAMYNNYFISSAPNQNNQIGKSYIYFFNNIIWSQVEKLVPSELTDAFFGLEVDLYDNFAIVATPIADFGITSFTGIVNVFAPITHQIIFSSWEGWTFINTQLSSINSTQFYVSGNSPWASNSTTISFATFSLQLPSYLGISNPIIIGRSYSPDTILNVFIESPNFNIFTKILTFVIENLPICTSINILLNSIV